MPHFVTRAMPINDIGGKSHKIELKFAEINQPIIQSQNHATSYVFMASAAYTHAYIST